MVNSADSDALIPGSDGRRRCWWCAGDDAYQEYHDQEWGRPVADDRRLFEKLCLEGFQAGLSWLTILRKRENFRDAFCDFEFDRLTRFSDRDVTRLLNNSGIVRHRGKIEAVLNNAVKAGEMVAEFGSLAGWIWQFEPLSSDQPVMESREQLSQRTTCPEAIEMSRELRRRGWKFVGPTTAYSFMQSMGLVNDHLPGCSVYQAVRKARQQFTKPRLT